MKLCGMDQGTVPKCAKFHNFRPCASRACHRHPVLRIIIINIRKLKALSEDNLCQIGSDWTHFVGRVVKKVFQLIQNDGRINSAIITNDDGSHTVVPRHHETKESLNKGKEINSYWPKQIFASCGQLDSLRRGF